MTPNALAAKGADATKAGDDLVDDQEDTVAVAEFAQPFEIVEIHGKPHDKFVSRTRHVSARVIKLSAARS